MSDKKSTNGTYEHVSIEGRQASYIRIVYDRPNLSVSPQIAVFPSWSAEFAYWMSYSYNPPYKALEQTYSCTQHSPNEWFRQLSPLVFPLPFPWAGRQRVNMTVCALCIFVCATRRPKAQHQVILRRRSTSSFCSQVYH